MTKITGSAIHYILIFFVLICLLSPVSAAVIKSSNVWDQDQKMAATYIWTPNIYSGLWYDIDKGIQTEEITLTVSESDQTIRAGDAEYITETKSNRFSYSDWGSYRVIGWQGEPYFAGYTRSASENMSTAQFSDVNVSTLSKERIYKVLTDTNKESRIGTDGTHSLEEGYRIKISDVDESGKQFRLTLEKGSTSVKSEMVSNNTTFVYKRTADGLDDVPAVIIHVKGLDGTSAVIDGVFQISDNATEVSVNKKIGAMEIQNVNETRITMKNSADIKLNKNQNITLMGHIKIQVKDTSKLKFALVSDPKTDSEKQYPGRSAVYDESNNIKTWNGMNYPELSYDYNNNTENENISINGSVSRSIAAKQLTYQIKTANESFNYSNWGAYQSINIGGSNYFAGYWSYNSSDKNNTTNFTNSNVSILAVGSASKVLINNGSEQQHNVNSEIRLEEGYTLQIGNVTDNGSKVDLILKQNGTAVKNESVSKGSNFVYESNIKNTSIPVIAVHIADIFGGSTSFIKTGGIFQISSDITDVSAGKAMGNMNIEYTGTNALVLVNKDSINLEKGKNISLIENISIHVADSDDLRFFFYGKSGGADTPTLPNLKIDVPGTIYPGQEIILKVTAQDGSAWKELSGATVKINGKSIGETDTSGTVKHVVGDAGAQEFRAEKEGYQPVVLSKNTTEGGDKLQIIIPDYIFAEDSFRLYVKDAKNKDVVGVSVYKNGSHIGTTNDNGMINITADSAAGTYALTANKTGYIPGTRTMKVLEYGPYFAATSIELPKNALVNKTIKIPITIENVGKEKGTADITITAGDVTKTEKVTLDTGKTKNITFSFKQDTAGDVKMNVANETFTVNVTEKPKTEIPWTWIILGGGLLIILIGVAMALTYYKETAEEEKKNPRAKPKRNEPESKGIFGFIGGGESKPKSSGSKKTAKPSSEKQNPPKKSAKYSSSNKPPELKNSQKKARKEK